MRMPSPVPRLVGLVLVAGACVPRAQPPEVVLLPRAVEVAPTWAPPDLCSVSGAGELTEQTHDSAEFRVFSEPRSTAHGLTIHETTEVAVTWSAFPSAADGTSQRRASIMLGGQKLIRVHAFADLAGRGFQLRVTTFVVPGHVWVDRGYRVEIVGIERGELVVRRRAPFASPPFFEPRAPCSTVAYEPTALDPPTDSTEDDDDAVGPTGDELVLRDGPGGREVFKVVLGSEDGMALAIRERRGDWVRVGWHARGLGLDAWARASEVTGSPSYTGLSLSGFGTSGGTSKPRRLRVRTDSPVLVGEAHAPFADAVFERGALLDGWVTSKNAIRVELRDREIGSEDGMWIAESDVEPE